MQKGSLALAREQGQEQAKREIAKNLLDILDDKTIAEKTGLSLKKLNALRQY
ncbi:MAG: hypothetical protein KAG19_04995 [Methylococcales bacterium]|nr:hypothetical protein [Methylococcales bacterium]